MSFLTKINKNKLISYQFKCKILINSIIFLICLSNLNLILCQDGLNNVTEDCIKKCDDKNRTILKNINEECGKDCYMKQCSMGCSLWEQALNSSCQTVCHKSFNESNKIYCILNCNDALSYYFKWFSNEIGILPGPSLVSNTLSSTSLNLIWKIPRKLINLRNQYPNLPKGYFIQWQNVDIDHDDWKTYHNQSIIYNSTVHIDNLLPSKKYKFRTIVPLSTSLKQNEILISEESVIITTLSSGLSLMEPKIVRAVAIDHTRIFISWEPASFLNDPLLSYSLELKSLSSENLSSFKDLPATENTNFHIFEKLLPSKNYSINVSLHNKNGDGPKTNVFVTTPSAPIINDNKPELRLILGSEYSIVSHGSDFLFDTPKEFYKSVDRIMGVAIHISKSLLFVSDESGFIYKAPLEQTEKITSKRKEAILSPKSGINFLPTLLSVDWLNDHLYILGEINQRNSQKIYQISRCNLNGQNLIIPVSGLYKKPNHIQVDPINGYLYWSISGNSQNDGLFRIDLADIIHGIKPELRPLLQLIDGGNLGAFVIDYLKYKIYIPGQLNNTIYAYSLDGKIEENIRFNTQRPKLNLVKSITMANGLFYWTNGNDLFSEEYHAKQNNFYHNEYPFNPNTIFITVALQSSQPLPIPLNPPCNLEVLLSSRKAKIMWNKPELLSNQGKGSWQEWYYELKIIDDSDINNVIRDIKGTYFTIDRLKPNTNYTFLVLAYTISGRSSYSELFQSKTLKSIHDRYLIWSTDDGLLQSDIIGEHIHPLISKNKLENYDITDITWFEDMLFFISNSTLKYYNRTSNNLAQFNDIESVECVDIDWIGKKIYWSIPSQQYVTRANFNGLDKEILPFVSIIKEFKIDSLNGHIYYSTGFGVQACRLNGKNRITYIHFQPFKFSTIIGLTLDLDQEKLYWIVRSYNGSNLYSAPLARYWHHDMIPTVIPLPSQTVSQSLKLNRLAHFSDRLMWLQDDNTVIVSDNIGKNLAHIQSDKLNGIKGISVIDPTHHILPTNLSTNEINVIPETINNNTIKIVGPWNSFNISWDPVRTVTYGEIFYEIHIRHIDSHLLKDETSTPYYLYTNHSLSPYTLLDVSIRPLTYWGSAKTSIARLYSPVAAPSEPINPKVFILHQHDPFRRGINISAIFRWSQPEKLNGPLIHYKIFCWYKDGGREKTIFNDFKQDENQEIIIPNLTSNITYYFQIQAFSINDELGPKSNIIYVNSSQENPIPKLLLIKLNEIIEIDLNLNKTKTLLHTSNPAHHLAYIKNENLLFWVNDNHELIEFTFNSGAKRKIALVNDTVVALTIDWIQRVIYWVQYVDQNQNGDKSIVYRLDLNQYDGRTMIGEKFLSSTQFIKDLTISPLDQQLFWLQSPTDDTKFGNLIKYSINLGMKSELPNNIPCLNNTFQRILFESQSFNENRLVLVGTERIFIFGLDSFTCDLMKMRFDHLTNNIAKDSGHIYLLKNNTISSYTNHKQIQQYSMNISHIINMLAYSYQHYPHKLCLLPGKNISNYIPELIRKSDISLQIQLPQINTYSNCTLNLPGVKYFVQYIEKITNNSLINCKDPQCKTLISYDTITEITNLKPFTKYNLRIGITNFYAQQIGLKIIYGPNVIYSTAAGAPSIPRNLTGETISPNEVIISWLKPEKLNSDKIWYVIYWQMEYPNIGIVHKQQRIITLPDENLIKNSTDKISISLTKLLPKQKYKIWIHVYSTNITYSTTQLIEIETFPEPEDIQLIEKTSNSLRLHWQQPKNIRKYILEYSINDILDDFKIIIDSENDTRFDNNNIDENFNENVIDKELYLVKNLQPKTIYHFSIRLYYLNRKIPYIWPSDNRFLFETFGDCPSAPGKPKIYHVTGDVYKITWDPSKENGATIEEYSLEGLQSRVSNRVKRLIDNDDYSQININNTKNQLDDEKAILVIEPEINNNNTILLNEMQSAEEPEGFDENWLILYNGTENYCIKNDFNIINSMVFRVKAKNIYGWGSYSIESEPISEPYISPKRRDSLLIAIFVPILVVAICFLSAGCMIFVHQKRSSGKKDFHKTNSQIPDVELANLRELPCGGNFIHSSNIIYSHGPLTDADIALLPQIRRNQIQMSCFLGSGAFGEVYEGIVKQDDKNSEIRVAIKTLRKGASDQEKDEFLQEAQLMSNFKHKHILQLIGICFDTESLFIIMELMEGGDLLTYLRQSRPHMGVAVTLNLADLISICVDVATGCRYLEEMHFVHRDLACRNCLVSSTDPEYRVVKIGDFGLARDIYKNDYYRKEGEGLLPVRWMSPESLVDGVFTSQSDIWAFGVLCWEVMTLGQQPYPARSNVEVLHFVRDGGRLGRPEDCPDGLYQLMLKCWSYQPEERPTFRYCLEVLHFLQANPNENINIEEYHEDKKNHTMGKLRLNKFDGNSVALIEPPIILTPTSSTTSTIRPRYIELLYPENSGDDYEIPIENIRNQESREYITEIELIENFDRTSSIRHSLCSNKSIIPKQINSQHDSKISLGSVEEKISNLEIKNCNINDNTNLNINQNNLKQFHNNDNNISSSDSTDKIISLQVSQSKSDNNLNKIDSISIKSENLSNDDNDSSEDINEIKQNKCESIEDIKTKI